MRSDPDGSAAVVALLRQSCRTCSRCPCHWSEGENVDREISD